MAIEGDGFYRLDDDGEITYTRAGQFEVDRDGFIVNNTGKRLTGFQTDADGNRVGDGRDHLELPTDGIPARATSEVEIGANLNADAEVMDPDNFDPADTDTFNESTTTTVFDSQGSARDATIYFVKTGSNTWNAYTEVEGVEWEDEDQPYFGPQELTFDASGNLVEGESATYEAPYQAAVDDLEIDMDFGGVTQFARPFNVTSIRQDGYTAGEFQNVDVEPDGKIFARYSNGEAQVVGQVALTGFPAQERLQSVGETSWEATAEAGDPLIGIPGQGQFGRIESGALEQSNVDVAEQLVNMITAQRNFSANTRMVTTQDQMTQEVLNIR